MPTAFARPSAAVDELTILVNNAGVALYDDLSEPALIQQQLDVDLFGPLNVAQAFLPCSPVARRHRQQPVHQRRCRLPAHSGLLRVLKAAAFSMTQSMRALCAELGVSVHAVLTGPTDTDMSRGLDAPKATAQYVARAIFDGLEAGEDDIFPDPMTLPMAHAWRSGVSAVAATQFAAMAADLRKAMAS